MQSIGQEQPALGYFYRITMPCEGLALLNSTPSRLKYLEGGTQPQPPE
jgi:hypothetical protein